LNDLRPGKPPESELDGGDGSEASRGSERLPKSLPRRRLRPYQKKVRSTTSPGGSEAIRIG
jgi:hypothetical protein